MLPASLEPENASERDINLTMAHESSRLDHTESEIQRAGTPIRDSSRILLPDR
jgi:hypothetical protein